MEWWSVSLLLGLASLSALADANMLKCYTGLPTASSLAECKTDELFCHMTFVKSGAAWTLSSRSCTETCNLIDTNTVAYRCCQTSRCNNATTLEGAGDVGRTLFDGPYGAAADSRPSALLLAMGAVGLAVLPRP